MTHVPRMISMDPVQSAWVQENDINLSRFVRRSLEIAMEQDSRDVAEVVAKLRIVNKKLNELLAAYQMDSVVSKESVR